MKRIFTLLILLCCCQAFGQNIAPDQKYQPIVGKGGFVQTKNYYLLTLLQELPELKKLVKNDDTLSAMLQQRKMLAASTIKTCKQDLSCFTSAFKFSPAMIERIGNRLSALYTDNNVLGKLVKEHIARSGNYGLPARSATGKALLVKAWEQDAAGINYAIGVYVEGNKPNYPKIDSIGFKIKSPQYIELVEANATISLNGGELFFEPSMFFALQAIEINERNNAADFEPMTATVNKAAIDRVKTIDWKKYKYSVILVPGAGPDDKDTELSAGGMLRCRLAAKQYQDGAAPFIVVSGGKVHPYKTKYSEALEMKKFLVNVLNIPENAVIMDPHARHTTTNMRNCVRLMFRYGMPMDKPAITSTLKSQSFYITDTVRERSMKELGYYPYENGKRLSDTEAEFFPNIISLQIDIDEPLDPK